MFDKVGANQAVITANIPCFNIERNDLCMAYLLHWYPPPIYVHSFWPGELEREIGRASTPNSHRNETDDDKVTNQMTKKKLKTKRAMTTLKMMFVAG
jgi:hypothetical protein